MKDFALSWIVELDDVISFLQVLSGKELPSNIGNTIDVNGDYKIGLEEVIYILQCVSELR
jgi:hypothetical protein